MFSSKRPSFTGLLAAAVAVSATPGYAQDRQEEEPRVMRAWEAQGSEAQDVVVQEEAPDEDFEYSDQNVIVVQGYRKQQIRSHVYQTLDVDSGQLSRREGKFCPRIVNFPEEYLMRIENLVRENAAKAGIDVEDRPCLADAFAIFAREPSKFIAGVDKAYPGVFDSLYKPEKTRLMEEERAVYSWSLELTMDKYGQPFLTDPPQVADIDIGRLTRNVRRDISGTYLVIDIDRTEGMTLRQLADFITMHMLIDFTERATRDAADDSILRLFEIDDPRQAPLAMSPMDAALIEAIYAQPNNNVSARMMRGRITDYIAKKLRDDGLEIE